VTLVAGTVEIQKADTVLVPEWKQRKDWKVHWQLRTDMIPAANCKRTQLMFRSSVGPCFDFLTCPITANTHKT